MTAAARPVFRFAPSPNGRLHLGHALSAILNHDLARQSGGTFLLRIEDIDPARSNSDNEAAILDDLAWLGLSWDGPVRRQSEHLDLYAAALDRLAALGLVYPAFLSRGEVKALVAEAEAAAGPGRAIRTARRSFPIVTVCARRRRLWPLWPKGGAMPCGLMSIAPSRLPQRPRLHRDRPAGRQ